MKHAFPQVKKQGAYEAAFDASHMHLAFWVLASLALAFALSYVWLINASVHNVVERKQLGESSQEHSLAIAPLESRYLALVESITEAKAYELGFTTVDKVTFASAQEHRTVVTVR